MGRRRCKATIRLCSTCNKVTTWNSFRDNSHVAYYRRSSRYSSKKGKACRKGGKSRRSDLKRISNKGGSNPISSSDKDSCSEYKSCSGNFEPGGQDRPSIVTPKSSPQRLVSQRVIIFQSNSDYQWDNKGAGDVIVDPTCRRILVRCSDDTFLLSHAILADDDYEIRDTIICFQQGDSEVALSFEETTGCFCAMEKIRTVQLQVSWTSTDTMLVNQLQAQLQDPNFFPKLIHLFKEYEATENFDGLHMIFKLVKRMIVLNSPCLFDTIFGDEFIMDIIGCLEYNPELTHRKHYRAILEEKVKKNSIKDPTILSKLYQIKGVQYIKDVILAGVLDEATSSNLDSFIQLLQEMTTISITKLSPSPASLDIFSPPPVAIGWKPDLEVVVLAAHNLPGGPAFAVVEFNGSVYTTERVDSVNPQWTENTFHFPIPTTDLSKLNLKVQVFGSIPRIMVGEINLNWLNYSEHSTTYSYTLRKDGICLDGKVIHIRVCFTDPKNISACSVPQSSGKSKVTKSKKKKL